MVGPTEALPLQLTITRGLVLALVLPCWLPLNLSLTNAPLSDPSNTNNMFVTSRSAPEVREGEDFLFRCLLTDPTVSNLTLQPEDDRGQGLPTGMTVTFDPKRGALIRDLRRTFTGHYVCSGWKGGVQFKSKPLDLVVFHGKICLPVLDVSTALLPGHMTRVCLFAHPPVSLQAPLPLCLSARRSQ